MAYLTGDGIDLLPLDTDDDRHVEVYRRTRVDPAIRATGWYGEPMAPRAAREHLDTKIDEGVEFYALTPRVTESPDPAVTDARGRPIVGWARAGMRDERARRVDVSCYVLPDWQGRGYGTEAARLVTHYAFAELNARKVEARSQADNEATAAILTGLGFEREATIRDCMYVDGAYVDTAIYGVFEDGFEPDPEARIQ
ncbi:N-acetyltransferase [Halobacteriales archaeon SW_7_68_16]|nr:MAG: N-acetyltransferase [Halobacteriales archaeon SW_7_68_16]